MMETTANAPLQPVTTPGDPEGPKRNINAADRFGDSYTTEMLRSVGADSCGCDGSSGIFSLAFQDICSDRGYGFDGPNAGTARKNVVCRVFAGLSRLLNPSGGLPDGLVRIEILESEGEGVDVMSASQVATASPVILTGFAEGIAAGQVLKTIQSGVDAYVGVNDFPSQNPYADFRKEGLDLIRLDISKIFVVRLLSNGKQPIEQNTV